MSQSIFEKVNELKAKRAQLECDQTYERGRKYGLLRARRYFEKQMKEIDDDIAQTDFTLNEYGNAILVATAQIEFVKECVAALKDESAEQAEVEATDVNSEDSEAS